VNSDGATHPVGRLGGNELGLCDMSGNVAEWCQDWVEAYTSDEQTNPRGPKQGENRVLRGGHYNSTSAACTVYDRGWYLPSGKYELYGLRLVMEAE
jgi:formylglycine-generating enzyme required for sulfatase activity